MTKTLQEFKESVNKVLNEDYFNHDRSDYYAIGALKFPEYTETFLANSDGTISIVESSQEMNAMEERVSFDEACNKWIEMKELGGKIISTKDLWI